MSQVEKREMAKYFYLKAFRNEEKTAVYEVLKGLKIGTDMSHGTFSEQRKIRRNNLNVLVALRRQNQIGGWFKFPTV